MAHIISELKCWHVHCVRVWHRLKMAPVLCMGKYWGCGPGSRHWWWQLLRDPGSRAPPAHRNTLTCNVLRLTTRESHNAQQTLGQPSRAKITNINMLLCSLERPNSQSLKSRGLLLYSSAQHITTSPWTHGSCFTNEAQGSPLLDTDTG